MPRLPINLLFPFILACAALPAQAQSYPQDGGFFYGYACKGDCSAHQSGYDWARSENIASADLCAGPSEFFLEGCFAWVESRNSETDTAPVAVEPPENGYYE